MTTGDPSGHDPYQAPRSEVVREIEHDAQFFPGGRGLPASRCTHWLSQAWGVYKSNAGIWILMVIAWFALDLILNVVPFGSIASPILSPIILGGVVLGCARCQHGGSMEFSDLWGGFASHGGNLAVVGLVRLGLFIVAFVPIILLTVGAGFFAFISSGGHTPIGPAMGLGVIAAMIAALVVVGVGISMLTYFAPFLIVLHGLSPIEAMGMSFRASLRNLLPMILLGILIMLLILASAFTLFLGLIFVLVPMMLSLPYEIGHDVFHEA